MNSKDLYEFGDCARCGKYKPLKNKVCADCSKNTNEIPEFLRDIFK